MVNTKTFISRILWYQGIGFSIIIAFSWIAEVVDLPNYFGFASAPINWRECLLENFIALAVAIPLMILTKRLLSRLYYLEDFLRICAWCKKLEHNNEWIPIETYFKEKFQTESSHGICPECFEKTRQKIKKFKPE